MTGEDRSVAEKPVQCYLSVTYMVWPRFELGLPLWKAAQNTRALARCLALSALCFQTLSFAEEFLSHIPGPFLCIRLKPHGTYLHHYSAIFRLGSSDNRIEWTDTTSPSIIFKLGSSDNRMLTGSFKKAGHSLCHVFTFSANYSSEKCLSASSSLKTGVRNRRESVLHGVRNDLYSSYIVSNQYLEE